MNRLTAYLAIAGVLFCSGIYLGYRFEHNRFVAFKEKTERIAEEQQFKNESVIKQQELVNQGIENEYKAKLSAIRNYYSDRMLNSSSSKLPSISSATIDPNGISTDYRLIEACSETTLQLTMLQEWIIQQSEIK